MSVQDDFRIGVRARLNELSDRMILTLTQLVTYSYPPEVVTLEFEIFSDAFTEAFPMRVFFMGVDNCEFFIMNNGKAEYPSPIDPRLIKIAGVYSTEFEDQYTNLDPNLDPFEVSTHELIDWFRNCWKRADRSRFSRRAIITVHDDPFMFELETAQ